MVSYVAVKEAIRNRILTGSLGVGSKLPPERKLVAELGASRNTVRKAIKELAADAYLATPPNASPIVISGGESKLASRVDQAHRVPDPVAAPKVLNIQDSSPAEILEARLVIEPEAVALAALRARSDDIAEIRNALSSSLTATDVMEFERCDGRLHLAIFQATRNTALITYYQALNEIRNQPSWIALKKKSLALERQQKLYGRQHTEIVNAIINRLPGIAKSSMRVHLESVRKAMML